MTTDRKLTIDEIERLNIQLMRNYIRALQEKRRAEGHKPEGGATATRDTGRGGVGVGGGGARVGDHGPVG